MTTTIDIPAVPALAIDKHFRDAGHGPLTADQRMERQIAWTLLHYMAAEFWDVPLVIDDGVERVTCTADDRMLQAMELIFNLDNSVIRFGRSWVLLICGNGMDMISDYGVNEQTQRAVDATSKHLDLE